MHKMKPDQPKSLFQLQIIKTRSTVHQTERETHNGNITSCNSVTSFFSLRKNDVTNFVNRNKHSIQCPTSRREKMMQEGCFRILKQTDNVTTLVVQTNLNRKCKAQYIVSQPMLLFSIPYTEHGSRNCSNNLGPCELKLQS